VRPAVAATAVPSGLPGLGGRGPVVYATLGTINRGPDLLAAIIGALAAERVELVVSTGRVDPAALGPQPDHVHVAPWFDQAAVLPWCDAVVTHGGAGTLAAAIAHGTPLLLLPISADQPMNAARCVAAGLGLALGPAERTSGAIRAATRELLRDDRYAGAAAAAADEAAAQPHLDRGLDLLEHLARCSATAARPVAVSGTCR
jgi:MGT family glycosyltransferase